MLTPKQKELLMFIHQRLQDDGVPPSFDEMKEALDLRSKSGIHRLITALEERGFIRRLPHRARALEVLKLPDSETSPTSHAGAPSSSNAGADSGLDHAQASNIIQGNFGGPAADHDAPKTVPVMGRIAAGVPISAIQNQSHEVEVPPGMVLKGEHYALEVVGDSMVEAGILDGDTVLIKRTDTADNGEIVVALIEDEEATLKRLRRKGASIALEAANPAYETRIFSSDQVKVQGKLVGLIRKYS